MKYSLLGETGLEVSHVGLGGGQFGIYNQDPSTISKDAQLVRTAFGMALPQYFFSIVYKNKIIQKRELITLTLRHGMVSMEVNRNEHLVKV